MSRIPKSIVQTMIMVHQALLIMFLSIMVDFSRSLFLMSTWIFFVLGKLGRSSQDTFSKGTFLSEVSFIDKSYGVGGGWWPIGL